MNGLYNRGNALLVLGRIEDARASFAAAVELDPTRLDALNNLGLAYAALKQPSEALGCYDRALTVDPKDLSTLHNRANALLGLNRLDEALAGFDDVLSLDAEHVDSLNARGVVLAKLERRDEALKSYDAALAIVPERADVLINRGLTLSEMERMTEALESFDKVLAKEPKHVAGLINRGNASIKLKRPVEALEYYEAALAIEPDHAAGLTDRGIALTLLDRFDEALVCHDRAVSLQPNLVAAHINRGNTYGCIARYEDALKGYVDALALEPDHTEAHFNAALTRLCLGDFRGGWEEYEYRWKKKNIRWHPWEFSQRQWDGKEDLQGKTIMLVAEQGMGDTLQFIRYAPLVAARGAKVVAAIQRPIKKVVATVPGISIVCSEGDVVPDFDLYCPLLTLPRWFETDLESIPTAIPYMLPYPEDIRRWSGRLPQNGRMRVGIVWAGNAAHGNDRNRSIALERFAPLFSVPGVDFISVQREVSVEHAEVLDAHGILRLGHEFADFTDTAAVVAMLDLLISVDTSVAHLAGAMGKPVALLVPFSPDWRWLLDKTDSRWYPSMRLFRQSAPDDWEGVVERVRQELADAVQRPVRPS